MITIILFADLHGKVLLPFKMAETWQKQYGEKADLILQCGDIGAFPHTKNMDRATLRFAKKDPQELGFSNDFVYLNTRIKDYLDELNIDMICVRGNHEDHDFLDKLENLSNENRYPIDCYQRVYMCKSGLFQSFQKEDEEITFMGIGRMGNHNWKTGKRYIQEYEKRNIEKAIRENKKPDFLISHDVSCEMTTSGFGMEELRPVLNTLKPFAHFYGHTGQPYKVETDPNKESLAVKIKELEFDKNGYLPYGCMIVAKKTGDKIEFKPIEQEFLYQFSEHTWFL